MITSVSAGTKPGPGELRRATRGAPGPGLVPAVEFAAGPCDTSVTTAILYPVGEFSMARPFLTGLVAIAFLFGLMPMHTPAADGPKELLAYFGTYTNNGQQQGHLLLQVRSGQRQADERRHHRRNQEPVVSGDFSQRQVLIRRQRSERRRRQAGRRRHGVFARSQDGRS